MRPIQLTFAGLRSYRSEALIDFADLDLFAIVGDTGAGKSTIIEALSLALYGKKTWKSGGSAKTDLIADGQALMRIVLVFEADGEAWTVTRTWRRSGSPGVNRLERADRSEKVDGATEVNKRIVELLGLDHAQFTQAVVMPQGRFDELLQASATDRSRLLASILGLDAVRRTGAEAHALRQRWLEPLALAQDRRARLPVDPALAVTEATAAETAARQRLADLATAVEAIGGHEARAEQIGRASERIVAARSAVPDRATASDAVAELAAARDLGQELSERHRELRGLIGELDEQVARLDGTTTKLLGGFPSRDAAMTARTRIEAAAVGLRRDTEDLDSARRIVATVEADPPVEVPDAALADAAARADAEVAAGAQALTAATEAHDLARRRWELVVAARHADERARAAADAAEAAVISVRDRVAQVALERERRQQAVVEATTALDATRAADAAALAAVACRPGDDCPVCRQVLPDDFEPPSAGDLAEAQATLDAATAALAAARDDAIGAGRDLEHAEAEQARRAVARAEAERDRLDAEDAARAAGCDPGAPDPTAATAATAAAQEDARRAADTAAEAARSAATALTEATAVVQAAVARHRSELDAARAALAAAEERADSHAAVAAALPEAWRPAPPVTAAAFADLAAEVAAMLEELDATRTERVDVDAARSAAVRELDQVASRAEHEVTRAAERALGVLNRRTERILDLVDALASKAGPAATTPPALLPATAKASALADLVAGATAGIDDGDLVVDHADRQLDALRAEQDALAAALGEMLAGAGCTTAGELRHEHGVAEERLANSIIAVATAQADLDTAVGLDDFLAAAGPFVANLTVLVESLRDRAFVDHLVTAREAELIAEADRRLRAITGARFGFVRDFGVVSVASGEVRTPDALSGGERFQAALALALSLVEIASRGRGRLEAVFVDEGFGSLDSRSLDSALATLGEVAGGGKMVGLISHLKPVAEAVETVLLVTKDDVRGSTIARLDAEARERMLDDDIRSGLTS